MTRQDRLQRIENDDGDLEDTVYTVGAHRPGIDTDSWAGTTSQIYHDDSECQSLATVDDDDLREIDRATAQQATKAPCAWCVLERTPGTSDLGRKSKLERLLERGEVDADSLLSSSE